MYKRICIFGRPGSGKSTFALKLHRKTDIPLHYLDRLFFTSHWAERDYQEFLTMQQDIVNQEHWIIDGNSLKSLEMRYARANICLYFNYPRWRCFMRLLKRFFIKDSAIQDRAEGCNETIRWKLLKYMWTFEYRKNNRLVHQLIRLRTEYPEVVFIEVRSDRDLEKASLYF